MGKSKREIKKVLKKEMKGKIKTKLKVKVKKKMKKIKLLFIILSTIAAVIAVCKAVEMLLEKKNKNRPKDSSLEQFFSLFAVTKDRSLVKKITGGVMVSNYFSRQTLDLSGCEFNDGSFIAIKSAAAYLNVIIPDNVNVKFDCIDLFTYVKQEYDTDEFDETRPTVYIALKSAFSSVIITKAEATYAEPEENCAAEA